MDRNSFEHFIITRFNLPTPGREHEIRKQEGWLEQRFDLFENFCLPSVAAQTVQNFKWIIHFDKNTPELFKEKVARLSEDFPFIPFYTDKLGDWGASLNQKFSPKTAFVATTRLDSDDALGVDFIKEVQTGMIAHGMVPGAYNVQNGIIRYRDAIYSIRHSTNAFFTYLEPNSNELSTAHSIKHMEIASAGKVFQIFGPPSWMQIVHDTNVSNKIRGWRVNISDLEERFSGGAGKNVRKARLPALVLENVSLGLFRNLRDTALSAARRIKVD